MTTVPFPPPDDLSDRIETVLDQDATEGDVLPGKPERRDA